MLDKIEFSTPEKETFSGKYVRYWDIPNDPNISDGFWKFWKANKIKMMGRGFEIIKAPSGKWRLLEKKPSLHQFKSFEKKPPIDMTSMLKPKKLKDPSKLLPWQIDAVRYIAESIRVHKAAIDGSDTGCHAKGQPILMADGSIKNVEDIVVGDEIMGWKGSQTVTSLKRGNQQMARIIPRKGDSWVVNLDHILTVILTNGCSPSHKKTGGYNYGGIADIKVRDYLTLSNATKHAMKLFSVGVDLWETKKLPFSPYFVGALLGDGGLSLRSTVKFTSIDAEIWNEVKTECSVNGWKLGSTNEDITFRITNAPNLFSWLKTENLCPISCENRFIPFEYKTGSRVQRLEMLAGLIDTDGHCDRNGNGYDFISKSKQLAEDFTFLCRSVGLAAYLKKVKKQCVNNGVWGDYYRVSVSGNVDIIPSRLSRKKALPRKQKKDVLKRGFKIELLPEDEYYGFSLSGDGRFLLGDFTVTHNTGKTYSAIAVARELDVPIAIVCPKVVIDSWKRAITNHFGMKYEFVINYEALRGDKHTDIISKYREEGSVAVNYKWNIPRNTLIVYDESHRLKGNGTLNSQIAKAAKKQGYKILCCSATVAVDPTELDAVGYILGLHKGGIDFYKFLRKYGCDNAMMGWQFVGSPYDLKLLSKQMFVDRGIRLKKNDIPGFPDNDIILDPYTIDQEDADKINSLYSEMEAQLKTLDSQIEDSKTMKMVMRLRFRQKIEILKVPIIVEMAQDLIEQGHSVVIMVNFSETIKMLSEALKTKCIVWGENVDDERQTAIDSFQADKDRIIILNIAAGGTGTSLHDLNGNHPRVALISPNDSAPMMRQAFGRIHRAGAKTKSQQRVIFIANTVEEMVCSNVKLKLNNLDTLNDGDLDIETKHLLRE